MRYNDVIYLCEVEELRNTDGTSKETIIDERMVFANRYTVRSSEHYIVTERFNASIHSNRDTKSFMIRNLEYNNEPYFKFNNTYYTITRVDDKGNDLILVGIGRVGNGKFYK